MSLNSSLTVWNNEHRDDAMKNDFRIFYVSFLLIFIWSIWMAASFFHALYHLPWVQIPLTLQFTSCGLTVFLFVIVLVYILQEGGKQHQSKKKTFGQHPEYIGKRDRKSLRLDQQLQKCWQTAHDPAEDAEGDYFGLLELMKLTEVFQSLNVSSKFCCLQHCVRVCEGFIFSRMYISVRCQCWSVKYTEPFILFSWNIIFSLHSYGCCDECSEPGSSLELTNPGSEV